MEYWIATQNVLQGGQTPLVVKPKLTDSLLRKPPFRFLHDVVSEVTRQTGFGKDLFSGSELVSSNLKDKEAKVGYLTKIINCVGICLDAHVSARPLKIVAGLEPEETNIFLQMLAAATTVDEATRQNAVLRTRAGECMPSASKGGGAWISQLQSLLPSTASARRTSVSETTRNQSPPPVDEVPALRAAIAPEPSLSNTVSETANASLQDLLAPAAVISLLEPPLSQPSQRPTPPSAISRPTKDRYGGVTSKHSGVNKGPYADILERKSPSRKREKTVSEGTRVGTSERGKDSNQTLSSETDKPSGEIISPSGMVDLKAATIYGSNRARDGLDWKKGERKAVMRPEEHDVVLAEAPTAEEEIPVPVCPGTPMAAGCVMPQQERPQSARLGPPKLPSNLLPADSKGSLLERPASAVGGRDIKKPNILLDDATDDQENEPVLLQPPSLHEVRATSMAEAGKLVRDILETRQEMEDAHKAATEETGIILESMAGSPEKKEQILSKKDEIEKLRASIQKLCQEINPLGKSVDNLQEGMQTMAGEYQYWMTEYETSSIQLQEERKVTENMLQAEAGQIAELEEEIRQQQHRIDSSKAQILRNELKIMSLLRMVTTRSIK